MGVSSNSMGTPKVINTVDNDDDAYVKLYLAVDSDSIYMAADVTDDVFNLDKTGTWYEQDALKSSLVFTIKEEVPSMLASTRS